MPERDNSHSLSKRDLCLKRHLDKCMKIQRIFFHVSADRYLGYFHFGTIMADAAMTFGV